MTTITTYNQEGDILAVYEFKSFDIALNFARTVDLSCGNIYNDAINKVIIERII